MFCTHVERFQMESGSVQLGFLSGTEQNFGGPKMSFIRGILFVIASFILIGTASAGLGSGAEMKQSQQRVKIRIRRLSRMGSPACGGRVKTAGQ